MRYLALIGLAGCMIPGLTGPTKEQTHPLQIESLVDAYDTEARTLAEVAAVHDEHEDLAGALRDVNAALEKANAALANVDDLKHRGVWADDLSYTVYSDARDGKKLDEHQILSGITSMRDRATAAAKGLELRLAAAEVVDHAAAAAKSLGATEHVPADSRHIIAAKAEASAALDEITQAQAKLESTSFGATTFNIGDSTLDATQMRAGLANMRSLAKTAQSDLAARLETAYRREFPGASRLQLTELERRGPPSKVDRAGKRHQCWSWDSYSELVITCWKPNGTVASHNVQAHSHPVATRHVAPSRPAAAKESTSSSGASESAAAAASSSEPAAEPSSEPAASPEPAAEPEPAKPSCLPDGAPTDDWNKCCGRLWRAPPGANDHTCCSQVDSTCS